MVGEPQVRVGRARKKKKRSGFTSGISLTLRLTNEKPGQRWGAGNYICCVRGLFGGFKPFNGLIPSSGVLTIAGRGQLSSLTPSSCPGNEASGSCRK